ncbi:mechanosensitive ion channel protein MscS [Marivirga tractuosa]|uniref:MscS Mechanosensitive ion channel n=1 Tax=Marivirga tractuosa (strain ATCC 23168 / DSM 4126 / NBRC 15989 / NCIMB 1408 / VKM B-1430 / H-43) TaxID=643867 RepID=E4TVR2_MARTH|nr:mechanosensitive ion channel domain-containing protein [Marivirga tractuosa]ADR21175.1 MscS Mechanosensitive ion channel [Marivirga tractuosa DSM 4126]BDD14372.1 mechanosensitive ion channel protein MscS [Marivirga tractuosa]
MIDFLDSLGLQQPYVRLVLFTILSILVGVLVRFVFFKTLFVLNKKEEKELVKLLEKRFSGSIFLFIPMLIMHNLIPSFELSASFTEWLLLISESLIIASFTIIAIRVVYFLQDVLNSKFKVDRADNIKERQVLTQVTFIRKVIIFLIVMIGLSLFLLQFDGVRKYGATFLTSAGVAGIIIGLAAQKTIGNLLAGIQIAFTQPIKIGDAVFVEKEWGWIEEINLTYVVVKIWDQRRLVLPITYFTEQTFQNWTRNSADIIGSVFLFTDYTIPIDALRKEFESILASTNLWNKNAQVLQITDCTEKTMQIRMLMSAKDSPTAWDLRCLVREKMLVFIQEKYPNALPKTRLVMDQSSELND